MPLVDVVSIQEETRTRHSCSSSSDNPEASPLKNSKTCSHTESAVVYAVPQFNDFGFRLRFLPPSNRESAAVPSVLKTVFSSEGTQGAPVKSQTDRFPSLGHVFWRP